MMKFIKFFLDKKSLLQVILIGLGLASAVYTQFVDLKDLPGIGYDEAWQGLFANKIQTGVWANEKLVAIQSGGVDRVLKSYQAMNGYTGPVVHFILAQVFEAFGPRLVVMRSVLGIINILTLLLVMGLLIQWERKTAAVWWVWVWALLPLSVHNHRYFIEMTSWHGLCAGVFLNSISLFFRNRIQGGNQVLEKLSLLLVGVSCFLGTLSHVLWVAVPLSAIILFSYMYYRKQIDPFQLSGWKSLLLSTSGSSLMVTIWMGIATPSGLLLSFSGIWILGLVVFFQFPPLVDSVVDYFSERKAAEKYGKIIILGGFIILSAGYFFLFFNGMWPYAQATGRLRLVWFPINVVLVLYALKALRFQPSVNILEKRAWIFSVILFLVTTLLIFKQSPRYYQTFSIFFVLALCLSLSRLERGIQFLLFLFFVSWNGYAFERFYRGYFEKHGAVQAGFQFGPFKDSARDFRPVQKVWWSLQEQNCAGRLKAIESDRLAWPIDFLRLYSRHQVDGRCLSPFKVFDLGTVKPEPQTERGKFLSQNPEWGDLAIWGRDAN